MTSRTSSIGAPKLEAQPQRPGAGDTSTRWHRRARSRNMNAMRPSPRPLRLPVAPLLLLMLAALAAFGGCSSATRVVVPNPLPPLSAVVLSPDTDTLLVGGNRQFTAVALDTLG